jgi:DNA-binding NarL/FixJ family response regulator
MIVDDHEIVRQGLSKIIDQHDQYYVCAETDSAENIWNLYRELQADILILDISLPGMGGIEAIRRLRIKWPDCKIMVFSIYRNPQLISKALQAGALSFVSKTSDKDTIIKAMACTLKRKQYVSPDLLHTKNTASELQDESATCRLSTKELEIFRLIAQAMNTEEIASAMYLSKKTVANNISIIKKKLNVSSTAELIHLAYKEGLLLGENPNNECLT